MNISERTLKIGSLTLDNNLMLAPMAGITNLPQRLLAKEKGAALCFTEMISAHGLVRSGDKTYELLKSVPEERPLGIQLFGDDPEIVAEGVRIVQDRCDIIDINMGCPVKKVVGSGAGSALMRQPEIVKAMLRAARKATKHPLTIKMRTGWNEREQTFFQVARIAEDEGCDAVTLHPRSRAEMFNNKADWRKIRELKTISKLPVIGSGDLFTARDIKAMLDETGCDGAMVARGVLGNPWIFAEALALLRGEEPTIPAPAERLSTALRHLEILSCLVGEKPALRDMRKHLAWYTKGLPGAAQARDSINRTEEKEEIVRILRNFFLGSLNE